MKRIDKKAIISTIAIVCITIVGFLIFAAPGISTRKWVLFSAQQADAPYLVVAHGKDFAASNIEDPMYKFSKPIELICEANDVKNVRSLFAVAFFLSKRAPKKNEVFTLFFYLLRSMWYIINDSVANQKTELKKVLTSAGNLL